MNPELGRWVPTYDFLTVQDDDMGTISAMYETATGRIVSTVGIA